MRDLIRRNLGKAVAGAAVALSGTAVAVAVALPGSAGAGEQGARPDAAAAAQQQQAPRPGVVEAAPPEGDKGIGSDPLTDRELERAEQLALTGAVRMRSEDVEGHRGPQHISTNLAELPPEEADDATPPRRARVTYYNYADDTLLTKTVNLTTGKVEQADTARGAQPPPTRDEVAQAAALIIADPLGKGLKADYKDIMGKELTSPGQLVLSGGAFRKETEEQLPPRLAACGEHRCVRVMSKVVHGPWINTRDLIVDLSARTVTRVR
ncbi:Tat pathway signal sequence domain protein [Streptomyces aurantiacus]|uniref:hypothetical protein n=1 Tax=Streptomyces aurantiacus TaxID=47760 RepID=UPI00056A683C